MKLFKKIFGCFVAFTFFIGLCQTGTHAYAISHDSKKEETIREIKDQKYKNIIIKFKNEVNLPYEDGIEKKIQTEKNDTILKEVFSQYPNVSLNRLFTSAKPEEIQNLSTNNSLLKYYIMSVPKDIDAESLLEHMRNSPLIEKVYEQEKPVEPEKPAQPQQIHELPKFELPNSFLNPHNNPRFKNQGYLMEAPNGINAVYAWNIEGADGKGVTVMDMEYGWLLNHEKLVNQNIELVSGKNKTDQRAHGTGVLGIISQEDSHVGGIGITPAAKVKVVGQIRDNGRYNNADALLSAINNLKFGDILLLEAQTTYEGYDTYLPLEVHQELFDIIRAGTDKGIVIVETAGNGSNDLDQFKDRNGKHTLNKKSPDFKDSGAILVGAGSSSVPHKRLWYSNYGSRIDTYGWGENVDTTSADPIKNDVNLYTTTFGGTSSAGPIIAGAAASIQGAATARWGGPYSPDNLRGILRNESTATPSHNPKADRIGVLPDLKAIFTWLGLGPTSKILEGNQFSWSLLGSYDEEFAKLDFNRQEEKMKIDLKAGKPHWKFENEIYANIKVQKPSGQIVYHKDIYGDKELSAETKDIQVQIDDFIELTHEEGDTRATLINKENNKKENIGNKVVYKVTGAGLEKAGLMPDDTLIGNQFTWSLQGGNDFEFAKIDFNTKEEEMQIRLNECEWPHWNFDETYASIKVQKPTGEVVYSNEIYGNKKLNAETKKVSVKIDDFIELTHEEGDTRATLINKENNKQKKIGNKVVYKVTGTGLEKVEK
ncbi:putative mucin/carbohydrate-binding domain-containing protein [Bacillus albus]|uniref:putative mucin/carbohydrate-binding domain-containing protein n=1 Tax=Bacillus albus TaxID=2026189 RepID=UPI001021E510|nr:putative mucin/carbohydrate-binding domain-containing protein [Bacillus albus]